MIEAEPGTILDNAYIIGNRVLATVVVDADAVSPESQGRNSGSLCPICHGLVRASVWTYCTHHDRKCCCFYCPNCWLIYENIEVGTLDAKGDYYPHDE